MILMLMKIFAKWRRPTKQWWGFRRWGVVKWVQCGKCKRWYHLLNCMDGRCKSMSILGQLKTLLQLETGYMPWKHCFLTVCSWDVCFVLDVMKNADIWHLHTALCCSMFNYTSLKVRMELYFLSILVFLVW